MGRAPRRAAKPMAARRILGISAFYHDSAACLLSEGHVLAALQEERFSRIKHDSAYPEDAVRACLRIGNCQPSDLACVVFYEKPFSKFERLLDTYLRHAPRGWLSYMKAMPVWMKEKLWIKDLLQRRLGFQGEILFADHHESHAASAFYPSPFESAAILTVDGVGEWSTTTLGRGVGNEVCLEREIRFPHSLGLLYTTFTGYLGFKVNSGEYKLMGLAPYGEPRFADLIRKRLIDIGEDGAFRLHPECFDYETGLQMPSRLFEELFGGPPRPPESPFEQRHKDLAASIQNVTEEVLLKTAVHLRQASGERNLCMAGGVALNCVANSRILKESGFDSLWIQPAAGDAGGALGAALAVWHRYLGQPRQPDPLGNDSQQASLLGTAFGLDEMRVVLDRHGAVYQRLDEEELLSRAAECLSEGGVLGWFQGRMEYGPRALGNRSILADPRGEGTQDRVNRRIKFRESFRPFAPAVLEDKAADYFALDRRSPYMLLVAPVLDERRSEVPSITHVDGSARVQTVGREQNPLFYSLLEAFYIRTGCPVLLNTSFNVRSEPIVESPENAFQCFMRTGMDALALGDFWLLKSDQPTGLEAEAGKRRRETGRTRGRAG